MLRACLVLSLVPLTVATPAVAQTTPTAPGLAARPLVGLGAAVAVSGQELFVGRTGEFAEFAVPPDRPASVHIFRRQGGEWVETGELAADLPAGSGFGAAIAVAGDLAVVGAPRVSDGTGAAFVFQRSGTGWRLAARLNPAAAGPGDAAGSAVAVAGESVLVGAPVHGAGGAVFVFRRTGDGWTEAPALTPARAVADARFGRTLAAHGTRVAVGAPGPQAGFIQMAFGGPPAYQPGTVHLFEADGGAWRESAVMSAADTTVRTLGAAVLLAGRTLVAGAPMTGGQGTVVQFAGDGGAWVEVGHLRPDDLGGFFQYGAALAYAGEDLLVGAPGPGAGAGRVYVMRRDGEGAWTAAQQLTVETRGPMVRFGDALAASDDLAVSGAPGDDYFQGTGFVLRRAGDTWSVDARVIDGGAGADALTGGQRDCTDGAVGVFSCADVDLLSYMPSSALGAGRGIWISDIWGWTDPDTGAEIVVVGRIDGTAFVDVSDAANPVYLGQILHTPGSQANLWRDVKVVGNHALIVADNAGRAGMQIFDLTRLRDVTNAPQTFTPDTVYFGIHSSHNLAVNDETGFAYTVGNSSGGNTCGGHLHMVDLRDPMQPVFAGCYVIPNSPGTHDAQCVIYRGPDQRYQGREICISSSATVLDIADVTDKANPVSLARATYPDLAYTHQGWLSEDHRFFYLNDELDELINGVERTRTLIFDVSELDDPVLASQYMGETGATDHNLYVRDNLVYESNYVAGLRILDISNPTSPVEVGFFDTFPVGDDGPAIAGSWSNYPFFASGIIVVTSIGEGLFVLKKRDPTLVP